MQAAMQSEWSGLPLGQFLTAGLVAAAIAVVFVLCVLLIRARLRSREWKHAERMKSLELGQPLPDADLSRARAAGLIGTLVPLVLIGAAAYVSFLATQSLGDRVRDVWLTGEHGPPMLLLPWLGCGLVTLITVILSLRTLRRLGEQSLEARKPIPSKQRSADIPSVLRAEQS